MKMADFATTSLEDGSKTAVFTTLADAKRRLSLRLSRFKICPEPLTMVNIAMIFKKNFLLKTVIDDELKKFTTHGLVHRWFKYFINIEYLPRKDPTEISEPKVLRFEHLEGVFIIGLGGLIISSAVFVVEICLGKVIMKFGKNSLVGNLQSRSFQTCVLPELSSCIPQNQE